LGRRIRQAKNQHAAQYQAEFCWFSAQLILGPQHPQQSLSGYENTMDLSFALHPAWVGSVTNSYHEYFTGVHVEMSQEVSLILTSYSNF
jgi:hypothetical protein